MTAAATVGILTLAVGGCSAPAPTTSARASAADTAPGPADSVALAIPGGAIWYTMAREARSPAGERCQERTLEVRRQGDTVAVPLLYTRDAPSLLDDSTASARIYRNCEAGDRYRFDLRSGQPLRIP